MTSYDRPTYTATLLAPVKDRLGVMKAIRALWPEISLKAAKRLVDGAPCTLNSEIHHLRLDEVRYTLVYAGANVEFQDNIWGHKS